MSVPSSFSKPVARPRMRVSSLLGRNASCCDSKQLFPRLASVALHGGTGVGKKKAKAKKNKNTPTNDDFLEHVSLSCACCKFPGTAWPAIRGDRRRVPLAGTKTNGYHNLFRDKVGRQEKKAKQIRLKHFVQAPSASCRSWLILRDILSKFSAI